MEENTKNGVNEPTRGGNKMKKKRRILAAVLCCALALVTVAYATNATKTIQAAYMNIKLWWMAYRSPPRTATDRR